jgi:hypothetical protein
MRQKGLHKKMLIWQKRSKKKYERLSGANFTEVIRDFIIFTIFWWYMSEGEDETWKEGDAMYSIGGWTDKQPNFMFRESEIEAYDNLEAVEKIILDTFEEYTLELDEENMVDVAVKWRDSVEQLLEEQGYITENEIGEAYNETLKEFYDG